MKDGNVKDFGEAANNSFAWTPEYMLTKALEDIREGHVKPVRGYVVLWCEDEETGRMKPERYWAQYDTMTGIADASLLLHKDLRDAWTED